MADGRTARPGHVTPERALCASSAPSTASPRPPPPTVPPSRSLLCLVSRSSGARRGPLKGTGSGVPKRVARVPSRTRSAGSRRQLEGPASVAPPFRGFLEALAASLEGCGPSSPAAARPRLPYGAPAPAPVACEGRRAVAAAVAALLRPRLRRVTLRFRRGTSCWLQADDGDGGGCFFLESLSDS